MKARFAHSNEQKGDWTKRQVVKWLGTAVCLFCLLEASGGLFVSGVYLIQAQYNAIFLAAVTALIFIRSSVGKSCCRLGLPWYDLLFILGSSAGHLYIVVNAKELAYFSRVTASPFEFWLGCIVLISLMEALRRTLGWSMIVISLLFIAYAVFGHHIPGSFGTPRYSPEWLMTDIYLSPDGIYGNLTSIASVVILAFLVFGNVFIASGGGKFFTDISIGLMGRTRGGPAKVSIVGSALFGTFSGSPIANVAVTGTFTIPMMKSIGYSPTFAAATEAISSTGGVITPPIMGAVAFVMSSVLGIPYSAIATAAIIPAILYYVSLFVQVDLRAAKLNLRGLPKDELPPPLKTFKEHWELVTPLLLLIAFLFVWSYPVEVAGILTTGALILVSLFRKSHRMNAAKLVDSLDHSFCAVLDIAVLIAVAGIVLAVVSVSGLGTKLSAALVTVTMGHALPLIILTGLACYVMGMGISLVASYILLASLVAPPLVGLGIQPLVVHFFIMYMVSSTFFTPPYCPAVFVAAKIANADPFRVGFQACKLGVICFLVPLVAVYNPALLFIGEMGQVIQASLTACLGIIALCIGMEGNLFDTGGRIGWTSRIGFMLGGCLLFIPESMTDLIGLVIIASLMCGKLLRSRRQRVRGMEKRGPDVISNGGIRF